MPNRTSLRRRNGVSGSPEPIGEIAPVKRRAFQGVCQIYFLSRKFYFILKGQGVSHLGVVWFSVL